MTDTASPQRLIIRQPDDWHVHLRDGAMLAGVLPYTARQFARAIVMPNLSPPGRHGNGGGLSRPDHGGIARGQQLHSADDALPDRCHRSRMISRPVSRSAC